MTEDQAYSPGAMDQYNVKANGLPSVRKDNEQDAHFDRQGNMMIYTENQANIFETEKTPNVHRSMFFELPDPAEPYDDSTAYS